MEGIDHRLDINIIQELYKKIKKGKKKRKKVRKILPDSMTGKENEDFYHGYLRAIYNITIIADNLLGLDKSKKVALTADQAKAILASLLDVFVEQGADTLRILMELIVKQK